MKYSKLLIVSCIGIIADLVITILFWQFESNPIVIQLGKTNFIVIKLLALPILVLSYQSIQDHRIGILIGDILLGFIAIFYWLTVAINVFVVIF